jgi:hypothetical protein
MFAGGGSYHTKNAGLFALEHRMFGVPRPTGMLRSWFKNVFNKMPDFYETHLCLCWIFAAKTIYHELRVLK